MAQERNPELIDAALMAACSLWAYLTPERRRDMLVNRIVEYVFTALHVDMAKGRYDDQEIEQLVTAADELLALTRCEGMDEGVVEWVWDHKWWFKLANTPTWVRACISELGKTYTTAQAGAGPLLDFARGLEAGDGC